MNDKFTECFHFFVHGQTLFLLFLSAHFIDHELYHFGFVCALILGYAVCIFLTTDTKYVMFPIS